MSDKLRELAAKWRAEVDPDHYKYGNRINEQHAMELEAELAGAWEVERAVAEARLDEARWWEHLAPDCGMPPSGNTDCLYCQRLADLERALGATSKPVEIPKVQP